MFWQSVLFLCFQIVNMPSKLKEHNDDFGYCQLAVGCPHEGHNGGEAF